MKIPKDATVLRLYKQPDGSIDIAFESGDPADYIWSTWEKSNWKSIPWLMGSVEESQDRTSETSPKRYKSNYRPAIIEYGDGTTKFCIEGRSFHGTWALLSGTTCDTRADMERKLAELRAKEFRTYPIVEE